MIKKYNLKTNGNRLLILLLTIIICLALALYIGFIRGQEVVYTQFFYIPVILAGMWYHRKAVYVALFLGTVHIFITYISVQDVTIDNVGRVAVLIVVAYIIGLINWKQAEAEESLVASKNYTESIIRNFFDTLIVVDAEAKIKTVNPATCNLLGYNEEELSGQPVSIIFKEEEEVYRLFQFFSKAKGAEGLHDQNAIRNRELTYRTKDGRFISMLFNASVLTDEKGNVANVVAGAKDITDLKNAEAKIRKERNFSENIVATVPDSLIVIDKDLKIKSANLTFYETFQTKSEKVMGTCITDFLGDEDGRLSTELTGLFKTDGILKNFELIYQSEKTGERVFNIIARGIIIAEEEEEEEEELVVLQDITKRKKAENELKEKMSVLERFNRLTVGRELRMIEMKREINVLLEKAGLEKKYSSPG